MNDTVIPYSLPEPADHSFFFIAQHVEPRTEAGLHCHEAWELYCVTCGRGNRTTGDTVMKFSEGDVVLIPPSMSHVWEYDPAFTDDSGEITYLMLAFSPGLIEKCVAVFPEVRNRIGNLALYQEAVIFGRESARIIKETLKRMVFLDEIGRLSAVLELLPYIFTARDHTPIGKPVKTERDIRRLQDISAYVMAHYTHTITLNDISRHVGMNRSAFCTFFRRCQGITFSNFVSDYRLETARQLLKDPRKRISEICYSVGFSDLPYFIRMFRKKYGRSPSKYRKGM